MSTWKTRTEAYHGTKWGFVATALVILIVLALLSSIFYLIGEGLKTYQAGPLEVGAWVAVIIIIAIILIILGWAFSSVHNFFAQLWVAIWALLHNLYVLVVFLIVVIILFYAIFATLGESSGISLGNPIVIGVLIALFILVLPFAIFVVDLFTYEHE